VEAQATLEKNWVGGWIDVYYWYKVDSAMTTAIIINHTTPISTLDDVESNVLSIAKTTAL
jgi:hypothetical protein